LKIEFEDNRKPLFFSSTDFPIRFGRRLLHETDSNMITFTSRVVSKYHAELFFENGKVVFVFPFAMYPAFFIDSFSGPSVHSSRCG